MKDYQEERTIHEKKYYVLRLADVRGGVDNLIGVAVFSTEKKLNDFLDKATEPWVDGPSPDSYGNSHEYNKTFKKGSLLEWYNPPRSRDSLNGFGGVQEYWSGSSEFTIPLDPKG